ncbi:hypothetical protein BCR44DRAFT_1423935 [Catenaria anguillulae PL171]|uniref:Uncharacterized protein n=1 Tax=Catenaria anguillulae PL171 TaxID=765915 RepID=A0A1Y2I1X9_9FUNG|nr:hypothetical protein BCR44DRAFT_1423935 [Catenaria anguillulae PL171]
MPETKQVAKVPSRCTTAGSQQARLAVPKLKPVLVVLRVLLILLSAELPPAHSVVRLLPTTRTPPKVLPTRLARVDLPADSKSAVHSVLPLKAALVAVHLHLPHPVLVANNRTCHARAPSMVLRRNSCLACLLETSNSNSNASNLARSAGRVPATRVAAHARFA